MAQPLVVRDLSFRYRSRDEYALRDISFALDEGEILLVAGASGCGKTTLIRCINGLIPRSYKGEVSGDVILEDQDVFSYSLARISQLVGTVLQDPERQILGSKVAAEVAFGLENLGLSRSEIRERMSQAMALLGIEHLKERETFLLSGGEKQKVALAGVLAMEPKVLLLDEPLASLDPASAQEALRLFRKLADGGISILLVEHRVEDTMLIDPDRVMYMKDSQIKYLGSIAGMMDVVDHSELKLPAEIVIQRSIDSPSPVLVPAIQPNGRESLISFQDVSFAYSSDSPTVIHNVNLAIRKGDITAILGPNGAGKTTLVKHAIGLLKPTQGQVLVGESDSQKLSVAQIASTVGYVFQSPSHMLFAPTVKQELEFGPTNLEHDPKVMEENVKRAIETVNMVGLEENPPLSLSFGQQKRVSIAAILAMQSKILVMDEPTAGQDYANYVAFMDSIIQMPGFEAILFITHDVDLAVRYANRVILVHDGQVAADGEPEQVLTDSVLLERCNIVSTTLLQANIDYLPQTGNFMSAETLARHYGDMGGDAYSRKSVH